MYTDRGFWWVILTLSPKGKMRHKTRKGVRIYGLPFAESFEPILEILDTYHVYAGTFSIPESGAPEGGEEYERWYGDKTEELRKFVINGEVKFEEGGYFRPGFLKFIECNVLEDWNRFWFFSDPLPSREKIEKLLFHYRGGSYLEYHYEQREAYRKLAPSVMIHNWDGCFWQMFSKDKKLVNTVVCNAKTRNCGYRVVDFRLEYPDPSDVALNRLLENYEIERGQQ